MVILGVGLSIEHFLDGAHYNPGFFKFPIIIGLHVAPGGLYLGLAFLQLITRIRERKPNIHKICGWIAVGLGVVSGIMAIAATLLFPFSGSAMILFVAPFALYFVFALVSGLTSARNHDFIQHRKWMIRAFAIATAIGTQRLILVPTLVLFGIEDDTVRLASMFAFTSAFVLHLSISEYWLYQTRPSQRGLEVIA